MSFFKENIIYVALVLILLIGAYLRSIDFIRWTWEMVGYDESRDMLVARHIVEYGERLFRGPLSAGSRNILMNSPLYYYVVAFLWFFGGSPYGIMLLWLFLSLVIICLGFHVGRKVWDEGAGLCIAFVLAVHPEMVVMSKQVGQPQLVPILMLFILLFFARTKPLTLFTFFLGAVLIFLPMHIHYGYLIVFPILTLWLTYIFLRDYKDLKVYGICYALATFEFLGVIWMYFTYQYEMFDQIRFVNTYGSRNYLVIGQSIIESWKEVFALVFSGVSAPFLYPIFISFLLIPIAILTIKSSNCRTNAWYRGASAASLTPFLFVGMYNGQVSPTYLFSVFILWLVLIGFSVRYFFSINRWLGWISILLVGVHFGQLSLGAMRAPTVVSHYLQHKEIASAIYRDYINIENNNVFPSFVIATLSTSPYLVYDGWGTGSTWYWLEYFFGKRLVGLSDTVTNFFPLVSNPKYFYVICDHREKEYDSETCERMFVRKRSYISNDRSVVYYSPTYTVWRYVVLFDPGVSFNMAYEERL